MNNNYEKNNYVAIKGIIKQKPVYSHSVLGEGFYEFTLKVARLSSQVDELPVTISERLLPEIADISKEIGIIGQLRSYNKLEEEKSKLILTIFAREIVSAETIINTNQIAIDGYICKEPIYRTTPFGREIADVLIAVNRAYNKSDYLPCIAWGRNARFTGDLKVGEKVKITGRIQSREYQKHIDEQTVITKTAYEVSISNIMVSENEEEDIINMNQNQITETEDELFTEDNAHISER